MPQFDTHFFSSLIFWEIVSFAALLGVLYKFAFPPILEALEARERKIRDTLEQAERHRTEAERKLKEYEVKLGAASKEAEALLTQARERAQQLLEENEQRLRAETARVRDETTREIEIERRKAIQEIRKEMAGLALLVGEQVVGRSFTDEDHHRLAEEVMQAVAKYHQR